MTEQTFKIKPIDVPGDLDSYWFHPDIAKHDTITDGAEHYTNEQWLQLKKNLGIEIIYDHWDYQDIPEIPSDDSADWSNWKPVPPEEGLFLIAAYDTEDGPVLWWAKEKEEG
ncbi:hypothetical protein F938_01248 [Acinetobacter bereziniae LMG 1003 = CIP 70.12]|uniref:DUF551 domain-containing protein n=1 Tax=Acinetobacter bereziniae LMG 1003 = CIP 70.12 TaxID=981324 RepID=N9ESF4_ACIBZ|nr:hypothetical protein [Acinetobacter bereziniae]ENV97839.1 hypothetical protein F938_01248 [Acinetobacter bereziniae LMG 1003 = CIP 70.12]MCU4599119.1 hypothetical protein [Acinetobacter bereziniae]